MRPAWRDEAISWAATCDCGVIAAGSDMPPSAWVFAAAAFAASATLFRSISSCSAATSLAVSTEGAGAVAGGCGAVAAESRAITSTTRARSGGFVATYLRKYSSASDMRPRSRYARAML